MVAKEAIVIAIPIYKTFLSENEVLSLEQCIKVLGDYKMVFFCSPELDTTAYRDICYGKIEFNAEYFDGAYFKNVDGYNKLMLSVDFYKTFASYKYMLIYQLDAWIFIDELLQWCNKGYDYIGAPWIDWYWCTFYAHHLTFTRRVLYKLGYRNFNLVGNGGFSLRKISSFIFNLNLFKNAVKNFKNNEDFFFGYFINSYNIFFKVAPSTEALKFSFDELPEKLFEQNNHQLPMACHAWPKYIDFWKKFINTDNTL